MPTRPTTVDEYIAHQPAGIQPLLNQIRQVIRETAPQSVERISYGMPGFFQKGALVWFGVHQHHIGFYPTPSGIEAFPDEAAPYRGTKSSLHFPFDQPIPFDLVRKIVLFRVQQNLKK